MTRRAFTVGLGVACGLLLWRPRLAFGDEPWWDNALIFRGNGSHYDAKLWSSIGVLEAGGGASLGGVMYTDRWVCAKTPWVEWDISARQFIRTAAKITMRCDFCTELYHHITGKLEIACGSYNGLNADYNLWHTTSGDDTCYTLLHRVDGLPSGGAVEGSHVVVIDNEAGEGLHKDGAQVWTDYRSYPGSDYSVWVRREDRCVPHSFQLKSSFWNYYYYGKNWYYSRRDDPPINYTTQWVEQQADKIMISSNLAWGNRVLNVSPLSWPNMSLAVPGAQTASDVQCAIAAKDCVTSQQWIAQVNTDDPVKGTLRFIPVHLGNGSLSLDQAGGGPCTYPCAAQLWHTVAQSRNQSLWVHDDGNSQWLFADCSGMALDRVSGASASGTLVQFHSNGYPAGEWSNDSHKWLLSDARFGSIDGGPLDLEPSGGTDDVKAGTLLSAAQWTSRVRPNAKLSGYGLAGSGIKHEYDWVISDEQGAWLSEAPEIVGRVHLYGGDWLSWQPAAGLIGVMGLGARIDNLELSIEGTTLTGEIITSAFGVGGYERVWMKLTGGLKEHFSLRYGVYVDGSGWSEWFRDGAMAGTPGTKFSGIRIILRHIDSFTEGSNLQYFQTSSAHEGKYIACIARAKTVHGSIPYRGAAFSKPVHIASSKAAISYFVDGEAKPCYQDEAERGKPYRVNDAAFAAGKKPECSKFECWFTDASCTQPFQDNAVVSDTSMNLYGRNMARVEYQLTSDAAELVANHALFSDCTLTRAVDVASLLGEVWFVPWSSRVSAPSLSSLWYSAHGQAREAKAVSGAYVDEDAKTAPTSSLRITADTTLYRAWRPARYEGIEVS